MYDKKVGRVQSDILISVEVKEKSSGGKRAHCTISALIRSCQLISLHGGAVKRLIARLRAVYLSLEIPLSL